VTGGLATKVRTNDTPGSLCKVSVEPVKFADLWSAYPSSPPYLDPKTGKPPKGYSNQCAIKVSAALHANGVEMKSFRGGNVKLNGKTAATGATELANWLKLQPFCGLPKAPEDVTGKDWDKKIQGRTGIVYFENYWFRDGETKNPTGDHIDLWDGSGLTPNPANRLRRFGISSIQWLPEALSQYNFSDLGRSTKILFWEIK